MEMIDFKKYINELSDDSFSEFEIRVSDYLSFYFVDEKEVNDRTLFAEKIGEYLKMYEMKHNKVHDADLTRIYLDELYSLMRYRIEYSSIADKYYERIREEFGVMKTSNGEEFNTALENYTKIFLTFYDEFIDRKRKVSDIYFFVEAIDYDRIKETFLIDKPETNDNLKRLADGVERLTPRFVKDTFRNVQDGIQQTQNAIDFFTEKFAQKKEVGYELIHSNIDEDKEYYTKRIYSFIVLTLVYLRLKDFELGLCQK